MLDRSRDSVSDSKDAAFDNPLRAWSECVQALYAADDFADLEISGQTHILQFETGEMSSQTLGKAKLVWNPPGIRRMLREDTHDMRRLRQPALNECGNPVRIAIAHRHLKI